jgi:ribonuclease P protein component
VAKQFTLGKSERIKSRKSLDKLFSDGKYFHASPFKVFYGMEKKSEPAALQFGIGVGTRNFKHAVDRNRVKRITRECYRLQKNELQHLLKEKKISMQVFFIYTSKELPAFDETKEKLAIILKKLEKLVDEIDSANS